MSLWSTSNIYGNYDLLEIPERSMPSASYQQSFGITRIPVTLLLTYSHDASPPVLTKEFHAALEYSRTHRICFPNANIICCK